MTVQDRSDEIQGPPDRIRAHTHLFLFVLVAGCLAFAAWAHVGTLDIVSVAMGEVTPSGQVKRVQHLEGGIVRKIHVRAGDRVTRDQPLVALEATVDEANVKELSMRLASLGTEIVRLTAEANGRGKVSYPAELRKRHPKLIDKARKLFTTRHETYLSQIAGQSQQIEQRENEIAEVRARVRNARNSLKLLREKIKISEGLLEEELTNRFKHLDLLREASSLKSRIDEDTANVRRAQAAKREAKQRLQQIKLARKSDARERLEKTVRERDELTERSRKFEDSLSRTVVRAPVEGIVKQLHVHTVGGVVKPGDLLAELVPVEDKLVIHAQLPIQDVGYVEIGQPAKIRLASADQMRLGSIDGRVVHISPDSTVRDDGQGYYKIHIATKRRHFERGQARYQLLPGVRVVASIQTGERTLVEYLLDPFLGSASDALRER
jgi:adhesin transport system membrane fusion protein